MTAEEYKLFAENMERQLNQAVVESVLMASAATKLYESCEELKQALRDLHKAANDVANMGAVSGSQWTKLTAALLKVRSLIQK